MSWSSPTRLMCPLSTAILSEQLRRFLSLSCRYINVIGQIVTRLTKRILRVAKDIQSKNIVLMDITGDNILQHTNYDGTWVFADFSSCKYFGHKITSSSNIFHTHNLLGKAPHVKYDYFYSWWFYWLKCCLINVSRWIFYYQRPHWPNQSHNCSGKICSYQ